jgi:hypothetical protein
MRFLSTQVHGILDYGMALLLIASPWLFGFADIGTQPESVIPILLGIGVALYSLFTDYEWGAVRSISMTTHLWMDALGGVFLAASPWLFGFANEVYLPHLILGLAEIGAALITKTAASGHREPETIR